MIDRTNYLFPHVIINLSFVLIIEFDTLPQCELVILEHAGWMGVWLCIPYYHITGCEVVSRNKTLKKDRGYLRENRTP